MSPRQLSELLHRPSLSKPCRAEILKILPQAIIAVLPISAIFATANPLITALSTFLAGYICGQLAKFPRLGNLSIIIFLVNIGLIISFREKFLIPTLFLVIIFGSAYFISVFIKKPTVVLPIAFLIISSLLLFWYPTWANESIISKIYRQPIEKTYNSDAFLFLNIFYQMKSVPFYKAYALGFARDLRFDKPPSDVFGWRMPTLFFIWHYLAKDGYTLWLISYLLTICAVLAIYLGVKKLTNSVHGLLSVFLLTPYFGYILKTEWFLSMEWWALLFFIIATAFWLHQKYHFSYGFFLLALLTRELFLIPYLIFLIFAILTKNRRVFIFWVGIILVFTLIYGLHAFFVSQNIGFNLETVSGKRLWNGSLTFLQTILSFGSFLYLFVDLKIFTIYSLLLAAVSPILLKKITNNNNLIILTTPYIFLISFLFIGGKWHEYWAILAVPLIIINLPIVIDLANKSIYENETS